MGNGVIPFKEYPYFQSIDSSDNLNNYKTPGMFRWAYAPTNAPTYGIGSAWANAQMEVRANSDNSFVTQIVMYNPGSDNYYPNVKRVWTGSAWGNWQPIIDHNPMILNVTINHGQTATLNCSSRFAAFALGTANEKFMRSLYYLTSYATGNIANRKSVEQIATGNSSGSGTPAFLVTAQDSSFLLKNEASTASVLVTVFVLFHDGDVSIT